MSGIQYEDVVPLLVRELPEFPAERPDVLADSDIADVVVAGLVRYLAELGGAGDPRFDDLLCRTLAFMERAALSEDPRVAEWVVKISFLEVLHLFGSRCADVVERLGPATRQLLHAYEALYDKVCPDEGRSQDARDDQ